MTKKEAIEILIGDFHNEQVSKGYLEISDIENDTDREIAKALKFHVEGY